MEFDKLSQLGGWENRPALAEKVCGASTSFRGMVTQSPLLIDECAAAEELAVSVRAVRRMVRRREIPYVALPCGEVRFRKTDLAEFVAQLPPKPAAWLGIRS